MFCFHYPALAHGANLCRAFSAGCEQGKAGSSSLRSSESELGRINRLFVAKCLPSTAGKQQTDSLKTVKWEKGTARAVPFVVQFADRLVVAVMPLWLTPMVVVPVAKVVARPAWIGALAMVATVGTVELQ
jgi:hypothetical protein